MKVWMMTLVLISGVSNAFGATPPVFTYDDHKRQDPFLPQVSAAGVVITREESLAPGEMVLEGIVADAQGGNNMAIINGKIVKKGDVIGPYTVVVVRAEEVEIMKDEEHFLVKLKKGEN